MTGAWYWYVEEGHYGSDNAVRIHSEPQGAVRGRYWVIPVKDKDYQRWHIYLQPKWKAEPGRRAYIGLGDMDCEWVFVKREKWDPPPKGLVNYTADVCECCGQEVYS